MPAANDCSPCSCARIVLRASMRRCASRRECTEEKRVYVRIECMMDCVFVGIRVNRREKSVDGAVCSFSEAKNG